MWIEPKTYYESTNYRGLIQGWVEYQQGRDKKFSYRFLARRAGFNSPNYFQLLISGRRNIGFEGITKLLKIMGVKGLEAKYFNELVLFDHSQTAEEKQEALNRLMQIREKATRRHSFKLPIADYNYLSNWLYVAVRELLAANSNISSVDEIANRIRFNVKKEEVGEALRFLLENNLIEKVGGRLKVLDLNLVSSDEVSSLAVRKFHQQVLSLAEKSLDNDVKDREFGALTLALTKEQFNDLKTRIKKFRSDIHAIYANPAEGADVHQLNLFLFPLTEQERS